MKPTSPTFRTQKTRAGNTRLFLQCSQCEADIKELKPTDEVDVRRAYFCKDCDDGAVYLNPAKGV